MPSKNRTCMIRASALLLLLLPPSSPPLLAQAPQYATALTVYSTTSSHYGDSFEPLLASASIDEIIISALNYKDIDIESVKAKCLLYFDPYHHPRYNMADYDWQRAPGDLGMPLNQTSYLAGDPRTGGYAFVIDTPSTGYDVPSAPSYYNKLLEDIHIALDTRTCRGIFLDDFNYDPSYLQVSNPTSAWVILSTYGQSAHQAWINSLRNAVAALCAQHTKEFVINGLARQDLSVRRYVENVGQRTNPWFRLEAGSDYGPGIVTAGDILQCNNLLGTGYLYGQWEDSIGWNAYGSHPAYFMSGFDAFRRAVHLARERGASVGLSGANPHYLTILPPGECGSSWHGYYDPLLHHFGALSSAKAVTLFAGKAWVLLPCTGSPEPTALYAIDLENPTSQVPLGRVYPYHELTDVAVGAFGPYLSFRQGLQTVLETDANEIDAYEWPVVYDQIEAMGTNLYALRGSTLDVLNLTFPSSPVLETSISLPQGTLPVLRCVSNRLYVGLQGGLCIWDISVPNAPEMLSETMIPGVSNYGSLSVEGNTVALRSGDVFLLDVANPLEPVVSSQFGVAPEGGHVEIASNGVLYVLDAYGDWLDLGDDYSGADHLYGLPHNVTVLSRASTPPQVVATWGNGEEFVGGGQSQWDGIAANSEFVVTADGSGVSIYRGYGCRDERYDAAVVGVAAVPGNGRVDVSWAAFASGGLHCYQVFRGKWRDPGAGGSAYPRYGLIEGAWLPVAPSSYSALLDSGDWQVVAEVPASVLSFSDHVVERGVYSYIIVGLGPDGSITAIPSEPGVSSTNYYIGDVHTPYDGMVTLADLVTLSGSMGKRFGDAGYNAECDFAGGVGGRAYLGLPEPDDKVSVADFGRFAQNYNVILGRDGCDEGVGGEVTVRMSWEAGCPVLALEGDTEGVLGVYLVLEDGHSGAMLEVLEAGSSKDSSVLVWQSAQGNAIAIVSGSGEAEWFERPFARVRAASEVGLARELKAYVVDPSGNVREAVVFPIGARTEGDGLDEQDYRLETRTEVRGAVDIYLRAPRRSSASIEVLDVLGRRVRTVWSGVLAEGESRIAWDGRDGKGREVAAGVYVVRVDFGRDCLSKKVLVVR